MIHRMTPTTKLFVSDISYVHMHLLHRKALFKLLQRANEVCWFYGVSVVFKTAIVYRGNIMCIWVEDSAVCGESYDSRMISRGRFPEIKEGLVYCIDQSSAVLSAL